MDVNTFEIVGKTENKARLFFKKYCCKRCGYTFYDLSNRWINKVKIPYKKWLWIIKLFELEVSARKIAQQVRLSYPTVHKAVTIMRTAIIASDKDAQDFLYGEREHFGGSGGRGAYNKVPVFGIFERNGTGKVDIIKDVTAESILNMTMKTVRRGSIVYTDKFKSYDTLMFCGYRHLRIDHDKMFASGKGYINGIEGFRSYAKERLIKFHGVSKEYFPLYLKEMEFRYNNNHQNLFFLIVRKLCFFVSILL